MHHLKELVIIAFFKLIGEKSSQIWCVVGEILKDIETSHNFSWGEPKEPF